MELGGNVWMLDRDRDGPWKLVERKASKGAGIISERPRKHVTERERPLLTASREDGNIINKKVTHNGKYEMITVTADSGAADHVAPKNVATHLQVQETRASRQGMKYVAANGHEIANEGQKSNGRRQGSSRRGCTKTTLAAQIWPFPRLQIRPNTAKSGAKEANSSQMCTTWLCAWARGCSVPCLLLPRLRPLKVARRH